MSPARTARKRAKRTTQDYWILDRDQITCLASAPRQDMVDRLAADGPLSVRELAPAIGMKASACYHHLQQLLAVGLVEERGEQASGKRVEKLYDTPSTRMRLRRALEDPQFRDLMVSTVGALTRQMERDFKQGIAGDSAVTDGEARNLGFFRVLGSPNPATLARINRRLDEVSELLWKQRDPRAPLLAFGWTLAPVPNAPRPEPPQTKPKRRRSAS